MALEKGNFIEIEFVAYDKDTNKIFDLTSEELAKKENIHNPNAQYGPIIICIGEEQVIKGLDQALIKKEPNKEYEIEIQPEHGFGKKDLKLLKLIPVKVFKTQNIQPFPGLQVNIDGAVGTIRTVSSGRSIVDFNHPLAGHTLIYKVKINKVITNDSEKAKSIFRFFTKNPDINLEKKVLKVNTEIPEPLQEPIIEKIKKLIPSIKEIKFNKTTDKS